MNRMSWIGFVSQDILCILSWSLLQTDLVERLAQDLGRVEQGRLLPIVKGQVQRLLRAVLADHPRDREGDVLDAEVAAVQPRRDRQNPLLVQADRTDQL